MADPGGRPVVGLPPKGSQATGRAVVGLAPKQQTSGRQVVGPPPRVPVSQISGNHRSILGNIGHVIGQKLDLAARDIKGIPGGVVHDVNVGVVQPWKDVLTTGHVSKKTNQNIDQAIAQNVDAVNATANHPGRDPFATLTLAAPLLHGVGRVGVGAVEAGRVAKAGGDLRAVVQASTRKPEAIPRGLKMGGKETPLIPSRGGAGRLAQMGYDKVVQGALDKNEAGQATGPLARRVAAHGAKRISGALKEESGIAQKERAVPAALLDKAAGKLSKLPARRREEQAAMELTSANTSPEAAAEYHFGQAKKGVNVKQNEGVGRLYQRVANRGLLTKDQAGNVAVNAEKFPKLAKTDTALARVQSAGDKILVDKGVRDAAALKSRVDAPGRIRAGATYVDQTPTEAAKESSALEQAGQLSLAPRSPSEAVGNGIVGGEDVRPGRGFVSARVSEKKLGSAEASASRGPVVGVAKSPIDSKSFTGRSIKQGLVPKHVTASASQHFRQIVKFVNTDEQRRAALKTGSDVRRSARDVLVRVPDEKAKPLDSSIRQVLGQERSTVDTADELATQEGLRAAHEAFLESIFREGQLKSKFAQDRSEQIGVKAPEGYKWVDKNALGNLAKTPQGPRGKIARSVDNVNSAVTAATVYFKVGHVGTRVLTNATTNIIQGSAKPTQIKKSWSLWNKLDDEQRARGLAASGQHGFASLPHEGTNLVSTVAGKGAQWWARHADAMFRFNSLAYELRKVGYSTPEEFTKALDHLQSGGQGLPAHEWNKLSAAARRADREAISYDRLNEFERRYLTRAIWFYPWLKGASTYTVRTAIEHPFKTAALGEAGVQGRQNQEQQLGPTPFYESGLVKVGGGGNNPLVTDLSTFSPFATAADVLHAPAEPGAVSGFFNPVISAAGQYAYGLNQYGAASNQPYKDAALALAAATPEQQLAEAYAGRNADQSNRLFHKTVGSTFARYLAGPALPRKVNKSALASAAARQKSGRR